MLRWRHATQSWIFWDCRQCKRWTHRDFRREPLRKPLRGGCCSHGRQGAHLTDDKHGRLTAGRRQKPAGPNWRTNKKMFNWRARFRSWKMEPTPTAADVEVKWRKRIRPPQPERKGSDKFAETNTTHLPVGDWITIRIGALPIGGADWNMIRRGWNQLTRRSGGRE